MTCRALAIVFGLSACFGDVPVVEMSTPAFVDARAELPFEAHDSLADFRWELMESPEGSVVSRASSGEPRPLFQFNRRGLYLLDRWIVSGLSERLTHHLVVTVRGAPPTSSVNGSTFVAVGVPAELDARGSSSPELRSLRYHWLLASRPALSQLVLSSDEVDDDRLSIVPDVAGHYGLELVVFDGELWSEPTTIVVEGHD